MTFSHMQFNATNTQDTPALILINIRALQVGCGAILHSHSLVRK